ncbi:alpha/beta hydrolase [Actinoplanes friuliensis]|uniref:Exported protease n=1 Tax=Actinoplanes friuliensis DSM 7358 TaxID=1246995 RepID=U5W4G4_9ACTN|nr:alpha/beta hydrolase [Actinoplanes friuliensis]AGZ44034.1 exported protease [Actinoplanes friuliensis DSM 7358]
MIRTNRSTSVPDTGRRILRRLGLAVVTLVAGGVSIAACTTGDDPDPDPGALQRFSTQKLEWQGCTDFATSPRETEILAKAPAQCAWLTVPLNYDKPQGATTTVAVLRFAARGQAQGSLVFNPGGPGGAGLLGALGVGAQLTKSRITERFDVIGFDPRGVGATKPAADCYTEGGTTRGDKVFPSMTMTSSLTEADTRAVLDRCAQGSGGAEGLTQMGTRTTARDLDVLRSALGEEKLTYLGQSYGTRLGAVYAEQFPQRVRAMVLDGAFDPNLGTIERRLSAYGGFQAAFEAMAASCAKAAKCPLGMDAKAATSVFQSIVRPLRDKPVPALDQKLDFDTAVAGVMAGLYSPDKWPTIISGLTQLRQGRGDTLLELTFDLAGGDPKTVVNPNFTEAAFAINCMDEQRLTPQDATRLRAQAYEVAPFMNPGGDPAAGARDACEFWPAPPTLGIPYAQNVKDLPGTLVISITGDPTTPHEGAISLAGKLGSALLTVKGEGHTVVSAGTNTCVDTIAADYLIDLKLPAEMPTCSVA